MFNSRPKKALILSLALACLLATTHTLFYKTHTNKILEIKQYHQLSRYIHDIPYRLTSYQSDLFCSNSTMLKLNDRIIYIKNLQKELDLGPGLSQEVSKLILFIKNAIELVKVENHDEISDLLSDVWPDYMENLLIPLEEKIKKL